MIDVFEDTPEEKEQYIVDMIQQGYTYKDIMRECHVSPSTISKVRKARFGSTDDDSLMQASKKSKESQAFRLYEQGRSLIDVKIELDISSSEVVDYLKKYQ